MAKETCDSLIRPKIHDVSLEAISIDCKQVSIRRHRCYIDRFIEGKGDFRVHLLYVKELDCFVIAGSHQINTTSVFYEL